MRSQKVKDRTVAKTESTKRKQIEKEGYTEHAEQNPKRIKEINTKENKDKKKTIKKKINEPNKLEQTEKDELEEENAKMRDIIYKQKDNMFNLWYLLQRMSNNTNKIHRMIPEADKTEDYEQQIHTIEVFIQRANTNKTKNLLFENMVNKMNQTIDNFTPTVVIQKMNYRGSNNEREENVSGYISEVFTRIPIKTPLDKNEQDLVDKIYCNPKANTD